MPSCAWAQPFSGNSESSSVELGTVSCPSIFCPLLPSFLFYTYFLLICLKKNLLLHLCVIIIIFFFLGFFIFFWFLFLSSLSSIRYLHCCFSPGLCVCVCVSVFPCSGALSQFFRLSHLPNFSFHVEMGGDGRSHRVPLATSWKLTVVTGCPLEKAGRAA